LDVEERRSHLPRPPADAFGGPEVQILRLPPAASLLRTVKAAVRPIEETEGSNPSPSKLLDLTVDPAAVAPGTSVTFTNVGDIPHTATDTARASRRRT